MISNRLKYISYDIVFQEVPNEVSLAINITGCPHRCEGCHSDYLWDYHGSFIDNDIDDLICKYRNMITCICFMGGDQNLFNLKYLLQYIKNRYKLKTCLYSGSNDIETLNPMLKYLDYIKYGSYIKDFGGINEVGSNQKFLEIDKDKIQDITYLFKAKHKQEGLNCLHQ